MFGYVIKAYVNCILRSNQVQQLTFIQAYRLLAYFSLGLYSDRGTTHAY